MKKSLLVLVMMFAAIGWLCGQDAPPENEPQRLPALEPGYEYVRKIEYKEVERRYCKMVPDKRSKWVYDTKPDYYCVPPCPLRKLFHHGDCEQCEACPACKGPFCRQQLMKKQIQWDCGQKCVVETVKDKVPYFVWRKTRVSADKTEKGGTPETLPTPRELPLSPAPK